ncbi:NmrA family NAD(P)-binding protein [Ancylobacter sp. WKF20]|uniref:NmrA family NAD(P)-binding protein n=1 Tax=Ancylobacter sp. WKF20 TaxID=3039801 RepID=UPI0024342DCF|nr:NmrA family NAD(P)-binding protein [Ancylobacter sp. WKF20]WGD29748.1 NmrA family NAD(P)-binding protein [Ancylobacter sp. WKF20]
MEGHAVLKVKESSIMYVVAGVSGQTGKATAEAVLAAGLKLRVVVRSDERGKVWAARGAEVAVADLTNPAALTAALNGAEAAYLLNPPAYGEADPFGRAVAVADAVATAVEASDLKKLIFLSSISAHLPAGNGMIHSNHLIEQHLKGLSRPVAFLRPGYFMENWLHVMAPVRDAGVLPSMLALDRPVPMVTVADIGAMAAKMLTETWMGRRIVELAGPTNLAPEALARLLAAELGRPVTPISVPREQWSAIFAASGMSPRTVAAFIEMFDGFNSGHIRFEGAQPRRGQETPAKAAAALVASTTH